MTSPTYFHTAVHVIDDAYFNAGITGLGQTANSEQYALGMNKFNALVNLLQTRGLKLWTNQDLPVVLTAGLALYTFGPTGTIVMTRPMRVPMAYYSDSSGIRRPLSMISRQEWITLSQVTQQGDINSVFVDKQQLALNVNLWLTPDTTAATGSVHLIIQSQIANAVGLLDTINFSIEWYLGLSWALACELAVGQPVDIIARCEAKKKEYLEILEGWDVEDAATFFTPDPRGAYASYGFR